ncbi:DUF1641 domain-containing protein [Pseudonocardia sp. N23]|uniref:DUF1641 domain-containing protein n=1 Tax=Pseudonocardia sp. N23 TaxID=1987376 RepID=UPI000BFCD209|nr:DUF1641 domain-containing protein [Pseudonocardia sp. N23]GAY09690.1 hypothetical protein TOK_3959 [Pseudonocardia sp. N23]
MAVNGQLVARSPGSDLLERLDDPGTASALGQLLDHADLLALLVSGLDGFLRRGDTITEAVVDGVRDLRGAAGSTPSPLAGVDVKALLSSLTSLSGSLAGATPTLNSLLSSTLMTDPRTATTLELMGEALVEATETDARTPSAPAGVFGLLRALKDPDVARGLGLLIQIAKALGRKLP